MKSLCLQLLLNHIEGFCINQWLMRSGYNPLFFALNENTGIGAICQNILYGSTVPASIPIIIITGQSLGASILNRRRNAVLI